MTEVHSNLFVGNDYDARFLSGRAGWSFVHAAKEPWHRQAVGYRGALAQDHPSYYFHRIGNELSLNIVDSPERRYFHDAPVNEGVQFIAERLAAGDRVLVHCNKGQSRGPGLALLYLSRHGLCESIEQFRAVYPAFSPSAGMAGYIAEKLK